MQILLDCQHGQTKTENEDAKKNDEGRELADTFLLTFYNFETQTWLGVTVFWFLNEGFC